jgi:hypothetical protein
MPNATPGHIRHRADANRNSLRRIIIENLQVGLLSISKHLIKRSGVWSEFENLVANDSSELSAKSYP